MFFDRPKETLPLTHHFKVWFGYLLNEKVVKKLEIQKELNPNHNLVLFVNEEILKNPANRNFLQRLSDHQIEVVDINQILNNKNLTEMRLKYVFNRMISRGLRYLDQAADSSKLLASSNKVTAYRCFAAASDVARYLESLMKYKCKENEYRIYSDTDYYFYKIPDRIFVGKFPVLLGTVEEKTEDDFNTVFREFYSKMDENFICLNPDHEWMKALRDAWIKSFELSDFEPSDYQGDEKKAVNELSLEDYSLLSSQSEAVIDRYAGFPKPHEFALYILDKKLRLADAPPTVLLDQRLDELIILNMKEGSWYGKDEAAFKGRLDVNREEKGNIKLTISKEAFEKKTDLKETDDIPAILGKELLKLLMRGKVLANNIDLKSLDNASQDFTVVIPKEKEAHFLDLMRAFVNANKLEKLLKGNLEKEILALTSEGLKPSKSS